jgi:hypothetical protein
VTVRPLFVALGVLALGCGNSVAPPLAIVRGQVTFRGTPLPAGMVVFTPDDEYGGRGPCATGTIGPDGKYVLATDGAAGVAPGKHRVTVMGPEGWRLPDKFLDPQASGLRAEVLGGRENVFEFKLEDR